MLFFERFCFYSLYFSFPFPVSLSLSLSLDPPASTRYLSLSPSLSG